MQQIVIFYSQFHPGSTLLRPDFLRKEADVSCKNGTTKQQILVSLLIGVAVARNGVFRTA